MNTSIRIGCLVLLGGNLGCASIVMDEELSGSGGRKGAEQDGEATASSGAQSSGPDVEGAGGGEGSLSTGGTTSVASGGRSLGTGGQNPQAGPESEASCTRVSCMGNDFPRPQGEVCFEFETGDYGGWQISNEKGCQITIDGQDTQATQGQATAGSHVLEMSGCSSNYVSWTCWY